MDDWLTSAEGRQWLAPFTCGEPGDRHRRAYAEWLSERGHTWRARVIELDGLLRERALDAGELRELRACRRDIDAGWWDWVWRGPDVRSCGQARGAPMVQFAFRCPTVWDALEPTTDPLLRTCHRCAEAVHFSGTPDAVEANARAGRCIAVPAALTRESRNAHLTIGRPDTLALWAERVLGER